MRKWSGLILALLMIAPQGQALAEMEDASTLTAKATAEEVVAVDEASEEEITEDYQGYAWETSLENDDGAAEQQ